MAPTDVPQYTLAEHIEVRRDTDGGIHLSINGEPLPYFTCADSPIAVGIGEQVNTVGIVLLARNVTVTDDTSGSSTSTSDLVERPDAPAGS